MLRATGFMLTAYYDLSTSPATYDIVSFLCHIEKWRKKRGPVRIVVLPGPNGGFRNDRFWPFSVEERSALFDRVALPLFGMLPDASIEIATERPRPESDSIGYGARLYSFAYMVGALSKGIRPLRPAADREHDGRLVTITLREAAHWPRRNSDAQAWTQAARAIADAGFRVVMVRDTRLADEPLERFEILPEASRDLEARAALYRAAACNLFVNSGPAWFSVALDAPTVILKMISEGVPAVSAMNFVEYGLPPGRQWPTQPAWQRVIWEEDSIAAIMSAFQCHMDAMRATACL